MQELWASASYEPHLLSLPFAFAPAVMSIVIAYALVMRGEPVLRAWLLVHFVALMPYSLTMALSPSVTSPAAAQALFRFAGAFVPMAAAAGLGFQLGLVGKLRKYRIAVWFAVAVTAIWIVVGATTDAMVAGVHRLRGGVWYATAGRFAWLAVVLTLGVVTPGFIALGRVALRGKPSHERKQLRLVLLALIITLISLADVGLAWGIGVFPMGWLLSGVGSVLVVRALVVEDLLRVRAIDTTAPRLVFHVAIAIPLGWITLAFLGTGTPWWLETLGIALCFAGVRVIIAVVGLVNRGGRGGEGTLDRLLNQLVVRSRPLAAEPEIAKLALDVIELALGLRVGILLAAAEDYGWTTAAGTRLADEIAPDPLLGAWLAELRGTLFADELELHVPEDLRPVVAALLERQQAQAIIPVASHDDLLALVLVPAAVKRVRGRNLVFLQRAAERLGEAIVHARMTKRATERAQLAREVELAAMVQQQLLPGREPHVVGDITIVGSWQPATRCAGDFWGVYPLPGGRVLVAIADVTGHGVASATVTAAAAAACDVIVRRDAAALDLAVLIHAIDAAVRRVGGGELQMTCFVSVLDPDASEIRFISCGHTTPYLCRPGDADALELLALVGRGNPLGGSPPAPKLQQRALRAGDLLVWYTDGVIEAEDPAGKPFGDRRLQRMLKKLEPAHLSPLGVHDVIQASVAAHRAGAPRSDDETLVVAQWGPRTEARP